MLLRVSKATLVIVILLPLLTACYSGRRHQYLALLDQADSLNRAYAQMPPDSLLREAADFFDRHGSADERVRAHYLLGCAYRDLGQAPEALQAWQDALDRADTLRTDSIHNALLSRVYSQMSDVYYRQNLVDYQLDCLNKSLKAALKCHDSISAAYTDMWRMTAYYRLGMDDSVTVICDRGYQALINIGQEELAASNLVIPVKSCISLGEYEKAGHYLDSYRNKSGFFDNNGQIEKGREVYYFFKGLYYLNVHQYDSAYYYFRKELVEGKDFNNQNCAAYGLAHFYQQTNHPDSAAKYALYSYEMNDSAYHQMALSEIARYKSVYDYSVHQKNALKEKKRADHNRQVLHIVIILVLFVIAVLSQITLKRRKKIQEQKKAYAEMINRLSHSQNELLRLRNHDEELKGLIEEKEREVGILMDRIDEMKGSRVLSSDKRGKEIEKTSIFQELQRKSIKGQMLTEEEWLQINGLVIEYLPEFYHLVSSHDYGLSIKEYRICLLLRLQIKSVSIAHMLGVHPSFITKASRHISQQLFNCDETAKFLSVRLCDYN